MRYKRPIVHSQFHGVWNTNDHVSASISYVITAQCSVVVSSAQHLFAHRSEEDRVFLERH